MLGYPQHVTYDRKYLIAPNGFNPEEVPEEVNVEVFKEEIVYLKPDLRQIASGGIHADKPHISCVKKRQDVDGNMTHSHIFRVCSDNLDERIERRRPISKDEYLSMISISKDRSKKLIKKHSSVFVYDDRVYAIEKSLTPSGEIEILRAKTTTKDGDHSLPPFLRIEREVTGRFY